VAAVIEPQGAEPLLSEVAAGSWLNPVSAWWGRRHPDQSGFATREEWARQEPGNATGQRLWGEALLRNRDLARAGVVLRQAADLEPGSATVHADLGDLYSSQGHSAAAEREYQAALRLDEHDLAARLGLTSLYLARDKVREAVAQCQAAVRDHPQDADARIALGRVQMRWAAGLEDAVASFAHAAGLAPDRTDYLADYAEALRSTYRLDEAEALLRRRLQAAPEDARARYQLAYLLLHNRPEAGREKEAEQHLRAALAQAPTSPAAGELAQLLLRRGQARDAVTLLRQALAANPLDIGSARALAEVYRQMGDAAAARQARLRADRLSDTVARMQALTHRVQGEPGNSLLRRQLADLYRQAGVAQPQGSAP